MIINTNDYSKEFLRKIVLIEEELLESEENFIFESLSMLLREAEDKPASEKLQNNEDILKKYFKAFKTSIEGIFKKFLENVKKLHTSNQKWLEQNKETILKADLSNFTHEIFPYWTASSFAKRIDEGLPPLSDMVLNNIIKKNCNKEEFTTECLKKVGLGGKNIRPGEGFEEDLKTVLRGNYSRKVRGQELSSQLSGIYDYCYDYDDEHKKVIKLFNTIKDACNKGENKVTSIKMTNTEDPNSNKENKQQISESFILLEEVVKPQKGAAELAKQKGSASNPAELNKRNKEGNEQKENVVKSTGMNKSDTKQMASAFKVFLDVEQKFLTVRITIMEEKFKVYMSLLRKIVELSNGKKDTKDTDDNKKEK